MPDWNQIESKILSDQADAVLPPTVQLPVLPQALMEFQRQADDPNANTNELCQVIASDAGLSAELLRTVNTCRTAARSEITSVKQALVMMGISATRLHLTNSCLKQAMRSKSSKLVNFKAFWNTNLERALFAREVAKVIGADPDLAYTAGMLQDFLLPLITNQLLDTYLEFVDRRDELPNLASYERASQGWDHATAAGHVMHAWGFPPALVCCVCYHHKGLSLLQDEALGTSAAAAVAVASLLPDALRQESEGLETLIKLDRAWDRFDLGRMIRDIDDEFEQLNPGHSNHFSLAKTYEKALKKAS